MLDHVSLRVQDFERVTAFYRAALAPIGYQVEMEFADYIGLGEDGKPALWITRTGNPLSPTHIAFRTDRARVDAFYAAALAAGGADNGAPGVRTDYHPYYYAAYITDPEGNNIEVVCHDPPGMPKLPPARAASASARRPAKRAQAKRPTKAKVKAKKPAKAKKSTKPKKRR